MLNLTCTRFLFLPDHTTFAGLFNLGVFSNMCVKLLHDDKTPTTCGSDSLFLHVDINRDHILPTTAVYVGRGYACSVLVIRYCS